MLPGIPVPSGRAADIERAVLVSYEVAASVQLSEHTCSKTLDVCRDAPVAKEPALEPQLALDHTVCVAGFFTDEKFTGLELSISRNKTLLTYYGEHLRSYLIVFT